MNEKTIIKILAISIAVLIAFGATFCWKYYSLSATIDNVENAGSVFKVEQQQQIIDKQAQLIEKLQSDFKLISSELLITKELADTANSQLDDVKTISRDQINLMNNIKSISSDQQITFSKLRETLNLFFEYSLRLEDITN